MAKDLSKHLIKGGNERYYFRIAVPHRLRPIVGKTEIKRAIPTSNETLARRLAISYAVQWHQRFAALKIQLASGEPMKRLKPKDLIQNPQLSRQILINVSMAPDGTRTTSFQMDPEKTEAEIQLLRAFKEQYGTLDKLEAAIAAHPEGLPIPTAATPTQTGIQLSEAIEEFITERRRSVWQPKTADQRAQHMSTLQEIVGDMPLPAFTHEHARTVKKALGNWPTNRHKAPAYRNKTTAQLLTTDVPKKDRLSSRTAKGYLALYAAFFRWAEETYMDAPPTPGLFSGLQIKGLGNSLDDRDPFTPEELQRIFSAPLFTRHMVRHRAKEIAAAPSQFWAPLLALYTGARQEEISSLRGDDIVIVDGVTCISLNISHNRTLKSGKKNIRQVPVHSALLHLGFTNLARRKGPLFPELTPNKYGKVARPISRFFARFFDEIGISDKKKVFHSFRHTLIDALKSIPGIQIPHIEAIAGHSSRLQAPTQSATVTTYGSRFKPSVLKPVVEQLDFSNVLTTVKPWQK